MKFPDCAIIVVTRDDLRPDNDASVRDRAKRHVGAELVSDINLPQRRNFPAVGRLTLYVDLPYPPEKIEVIDENAT
jgi:hypothetical protein